MWLSTQTLLKLSFIMFIIQLWLHIGCTNIQISSKDQISPKSVLHNTGALALKQLVISYTIFFLLKHGIILVVEVHTRRPRPLLSVRYGLW